MKNPAVNSSSYLDEDLEDEFVQDSPTLSAKHGTTVQAGWGAAKAALKPKEKTSAYPTNFRFSEQATLVRFLDNEPFAVYDEHWVDRTEGRRSFVCLGEDCPLCTIANQKPRAKFSFNVMVVSDGEPNVQIMTVPPTFARQLESANDDPRRGPLTKFYWALSRIGVGRDTQYNLDRVRATDLAEDWELDADVLDEAAASAKRYDLSTVYVSPYEDVLEVAKSIAG
jgi:hypothetical protein